MSRGLAWRLRALAACMCKDLSSNVSTHVKNTAVHGPGILSQSDQDCCGSLTGNIFRFSGRPCLEEIRQRGRARYARTSSDIQECV